LPPHTEVQAVNNLSVGLGVFSPGAPGTFEGNHHTLRFTLEDVAALDFALKPNSALRATGVDPARWPDAELTPRAEFALPVGTTPLPPRDRWSPGAFQR